MRNALTELGRATYIAVMPRLISALLTFSLLSCTASAESRLESAIEAANKNNSNTFLSYLDKDSRDFVDRVHEEARFLDPEWTFLEGRIEQLLKGAEIASTEEISGSAIRVKLSGAESELRSLWMLKTGSGLFPEWEVHLLSSPELFNSLRTGE